MNGNVRGVKMEECEGGEDTVVYICGYLPGASPERSPILSPSLVRLPDRVGGRDSWTEVCGGGCGFAMAISGSGKLITWGSVEDEGQSYLTSGKHEETPEPFPLPTEASVVKAAAGWAHCVSVIETGEVYTWGWRECIPSGKVICDLASVGCFQKDILGTQILPEQGSPRSQGPNLTGRAVSNLDSKKGGEEVIKRRKIASAKQEPETSVPGDEFFTISPCLVTLGPGVRIATVAAGGRHTLALSGKLFNVMARNGGAHYDDSFFFFVVWGWGYGGEGQLGLGSRVKMVSTPHVIPCIEFPATGKVSQDNKAMLAQASKVPGTFVKEIACGGRHSVIITDAGALLTFGWGMYGQCGQGGTYDQLRPTYVNSLLGVQVEKIAAGLWHTVCVSAEGRVYAFGGNQFGQLGTGADQAETLPKLLDSPILEGKKAKIISCGARHSAILTEEGQVFSWGWNKYGQLGLGDSADRTTPSRVAINGVPKNVACGWWHTLLLAKTPN